MCEREAALLTQKELARILEISQRTLERWRSESLGPPFVALVPGGKIRYRVQDIEQWLKDQLVRPMRTNVKIGESDRLYSAWTKPKRR